jgi:hypothetical protein
MAINQNVKQSAFGAKSRREFTLPPFPEPPDVLMRRFPEMREYAAATEQWRQAAQQLIADAILALSESTTP